MNIQRRRTFIAKKKLSAPLNYRPWESWEAGDYVIGKFVGINVCQFKKKNWKVEGEEAEFEDGTSANLVKKTLVLNACGKLEKLYDEGEVEEGMFIRVGYLGQAELTKGPFAGKLAHQLEVDIMEMEDDSLSDTTGF